jgi:hypothetical protein
MAKVDHSKRAHALLAPSASSRWLNCTPSARLEDEYGEHKPSPYAEEGTIAHELCEVMLRHELAKLGALDYSESSYNEDYDAVAEKAADKGYYGEEMIDSAREYVTTCVGLYNELYDKNGSADVFIEMRTDLRDYIPEAFGSIDFCCASDDQLYVVDFKYGKGIPVSATMNTQMMVYALGALKKLGMLYDIDKVSLIIVQPRINNLDRYDMSVDDLFGWATNTLIPKAAEAFEGKGELVAGGWCQFCSVKVRCKALYEEQIKMAAYDFKEPDLLTDDELADIVLRSKGFIEWVNAIQEYVYNRAVNNGDEFKGLKLVEGRKTRKWNCDEKTAMTAIKTRFKLMDEDIYEQKAKSLTAIEKLVGKKAFEEKANDLIMLKSSGLSLVPSDDPRPEAQTSAAKDFNEQDLQDLL